MHTPHSPVYVNPGYVHAYYAPHPALADGAKSQRRKSFALSLSSSVKSLFARRSQSKSVGAPPALQVRDTWLATDPTPEIPAPSKRCSATVYAGSIKHRGSMQSLGLDDECGTQQPSNRYSQARARVLAETARRLQQTRPQSPLTPSSIGTGKTLPYFAEGAECERQSDDRELVAEPACDVRGLARPGALPFVTGLCSPVDDSRAQSLQSTSRETLRVPSVEKHVESSAHGQRYSVAISQNLNRRFQTRVAHEYEQRIYCLHTHYSDVIERMEARARGDSEQLKELHRELDSLRSDNNALKSRVSELKSQNRAGVWSLRRVGTITGKRSASNKGTEFADQYQDEVQRLTRETVTAQEWVITLAELVIGPKREHQSWDEWLTLCLDTLQRRREQQEQEWLKKVGWRSSVQIGPTR